MYSKKQTNNMHTTQEIFPNQQERPHVEDLLLHGEANSAAIDVSTGTYPGEEVCTVSSSPEQSFKVIKYGKGMIVVDTSKRPDEENSYHILGENKSIDVSSSGELVQDAMKEERLLRISNTVIRIGSDTHKDIRKRLVTVVSDPEEIVHVQADRDLLVHK